MKKDLILKFIIPVGGLSHHRAKQSLAQVMNAYKDFQLNEYDVKQIWLPTKEDISPDVQAIIPSELNETDKEEIKKLVDENWNLLTNELKMVFKIPVGEKSTSDVSKMLDEMLASYKEDIKWDENTGEVNINSLKQLPFTKQVYFVNKDEKFEMECLEGECKCKPTPKLTFWQKIKNLFK